MYFFTSTINNWQNLLDDDKIKEILINTLKWFVVNKKAAIQGFVIMPNHFHVLWTPLDEYYDLGSSFKSFTGSTILKYLKKENPEVLKNYISSQADRKYHFWKRRSYNIEIMSRAIAGQKLEYIHKNPLQEKWKLVDIAEDYLYSSASFYLSNDDKFSFLSRYEDWC